MLETLKDETYIRGFEIARKDMFISSAKPIWIYDPLNIIAFQLQNGPTKTAGINGCQLTTVIEAVKLILIGLNKEVPCNENQRALQGLDDAICWLDDRKKARELRSVLGTMEI